MLQPAGSDASSMDPSRHKFMVQTCYTPGENVDLEGLWKVRSLSSLLSRPSILLSTFPDFTWCIVKHKELLAECR